MNFDNYTVRFRLMKDSVENTRCVEEREREKKRKKRAGVTDDSMVHTVDTHSAA